jgi:hypothetical protein
MFNPPVTPLELGGASFSHNSLWAVDRYLYKNTILGSENLSVRHHFNHFSTGLCYLKRQIRLEGCRTKSILPPKKGGKTMNRLFEYEDRARVRGFAVLDEDFELMLGDLCCEVEAEPTPEKTRESLARNRTVCLDPMVWLYVV